jgi:hypothetical protein
VRERWGSALACGDVRRKKPREEGELTGETEVGRRTAAMELGRKKIGVGEGGARGGGGGSGLACVLLKWLPVVTLARREQGSRVAVRWAWLP